MPATGTGLMCVHRLVFEEMLEAGAAEHLPEMEKFPLHKGLKFCDFFTHITRHGVIHGEDASFCYRWVNLCGGEIWLDASQIVSHWGSRAHTARYMEQLLSQYPALARQLKEMAEAKENQ